MNRLFIRNDAVYRLIRTIIQGIIGVLIANVDLLVAGLSFSPEIKAMIVALVMAVLSPIMAALGTDEVEKPELDENYFEEEGADDER